jgi:hypothetical protein
MYAHKGHVTRPYSTPLRNIGTHPHVESCHHVSGRDQYVTGTIHHSVVCIGRAIFSPPHTCQTHYDSPHPHTLINMSYCYFDIMSHNISILLLTPPLVSTLDARFAMSKKAPLITWCPSCGISCQGSRGYTTHLTYYPQCAENASGKSNQSSKQQSLSSHNKQYATKMSNLVQGASKRVSSPHLCQTHRHAIISHTRIIMSSTIFK